MGLFVCRRSASLISFSFAHMRSRRDFLLIRKSPRRDLSQMSTKPRNLKVSGLERRASCSSAPQSDRTQSGGSYPDEAKARTPAACHASRPRSGGGALMLETGDEVVGIPDHDHVARGLAPSPALGPEVEDVVEIDVGKQRRNHRALTRP